MRVHAYLRKGYNAGAGIFEEGVQCAGIFEEGVQCGCRQIQGRGAMQVWAYTFEEGYGAGAGIFEERYSVGAGIHIRGGGTVQVQAYSRKDSVGAGIFEEGVQCGCRRIQGRGAMQVWAYTFEEGYGAGAGIFEEGVQCGCRRIQGRGAMRVWAYTFEEGYGEGAGIFEEGVYLRKGCNASAGVHIRGRGTVRAQAYTFEEGVRCERRHTHSGGWGYSAGAGIFEEGVQCGCSRIQGRGAMRVWAYTFEEGGYGAGAGVSIFEEGRRGYHAGAGVFEEGQSCPEVEGWFLVPKQPLQGPKIPKTSCASAGGNICTVLVGAGASTPVVPVGSPFMVSPASPMSSTSSLYNDDVKSEPASPKLHLCAPPHVTLDTRMQLTPTGRVRGAALVAACDPPHVPPVAPAVGAQPAVLDNAAPHAGRQAAAPGTPQLMAVTHPNEYKDVITYGIRGVCIFYPTHAAAWAAAKRLGMGDQEILTGKVAKVQAWMHGLPFHGAD
ncbi:hypothetical protein K438DRAFT_1784892 [Mycena galopus ATCC 62051]|nr:hypothetical protein K438DRAFT_1784892 [Mycena galopus ATCC 62051]